MPLFCSADPRPTSARSAPALRGGLWRGRGARPLALALLLTAGVSCGDADESGSSAAQPIDSITSPTADAQVAPVWTDRAWVRTDATDLPGRLRVFLSDGTLIQDSCWEVYRLSAWRQTEDGDIVWSEDGQEIRAQVTEASEEMLRLRLELVEAPHEESYRPAQVPYVCPEMVR